MIHCNIIAWGQIKVKSVQLKTIAYNNHIFNLKKENNLISKLELSTSKTQKN